jgi:N-acetyl-anhydromuramoyl-L-alanine amidase
MQVDRDGWLDVGIHIPSPNQDERPEGERITLVVVHSISLPPGRFEGPGVTALFTNSIDPSTHTSFPEIVHLRVSAHLFIRSDGSLVQYVPFVRRAWHAGVSAWRGRARCNDFSIGIELEGSDFLPFAEAQYQALDAVLRTLKSTYPIVDVCGHCAVAPGRKTDPGPFFEWSRIAM